MALTLTTITCVGCGRTKHVLGRVDPELEGWLHDAQRNRWACSSACAGRVARLELRNRAHGARRRR